MTTILYKKFIIALTLNPFCKLATSIGIFLILNLLLTGPVQAEEYNHEEKSESFYERNRTVLMVLGAVTVVIVIVLYYKYGDWDNTPITERTYLELNPANAKLLFNNFAQIIANCRTEPESHITIPVSTINWVTSCAPFYTWLNADKGEELFQVLCAGIELSDANALGILQHLYTGFAMSGNKVLECPTAEAIANAYWKIFSELRVVPVKV